MVTGSREDYNETKYSTISKEYDVSVSPELPSAMNRNSTLRFNDKMTVTGGAREMYVLSLDAEQLAWSNLPPP